MSLITYLNPNAIEDSSIEGIKLKDGSITSSKIDSSVASKKYVDDTIASAISASDAMVFKGTIGTGGTSESLPSTAIVGDTYKVIALTTIPGASSYTGVEETAKVGDLIVAISAEPKWIVVPSGDEAIDALVQPITWSDLKAKRDAGELTPGMQYRITDYTCTTTSTGTKSAGHVFDVIVTANDESTLNEVARAVKHDGDTYFTACDLNAWKLWYCLDNDTTRFAWADGTNGKGVIYRMIDEFNNDIPYDFKNIQFKHPKDTTTYPYYYYTFASGNVEDNTDCSLNISSMCYSNTIKNTTLKGENINEPPMILNQIIFISNMCVSNTFGYDCNSNSFGAICIYNTFGNGCTGNTFGGGCASNTFGIGCTDNTFGEICSANTFGDGCQSNTFAGTCQYNTVGKNFRDNTFGDVCTYNTFGYAYANNTAGNHFQSNTFGDGCQGNTFGDQCTDNIFANYCFGNTFGNKCSYNTFGNGFEFNTVGNECRGNTFGNICVYIKFASDSSESATKYNYYQYNHFGDGCQYILFKGTETASASTQVQNYNFSQGLQGTSDAYLTVDGVRNRSFETKVARNYNGELKIYCEADLIQ